jgi:hypothetical protein
MGLEKNLRGICGGSVKEYCRQLTLFQYLALVEEYLSFGVRRLDAAFACGGFDAALCRSRLVTPTAPLEVAKTRRQAASDQSGVELPHSKTPWRVLSRNDDLRT